MVKKIAPSLEVLIAYKVKKLLRRMHLNKDVIIGFIGDRGDGKSVGAGLVACLDYGIEPGAIIRSNMDIQIDISVSDAEAARYGLNGGTVHYQSKELDKGKFLGFDDSYKGAIYVVDEINIWLADARRATSNQNLYTDDVGQELRKWESPLIYTCIHEMFVDSRIRDLTDIFVKTEDTALTPLGLSRRQKQGIEFQWYIYAMSRKLTGERYADTHQRIGPFYIRGKPVWGLIDTNKRQERKKFNPAAAGREMELSVKQDAQTRAFMKQFGWVGEKLVELRNQGVDSLSTKEMRRLFANVPKDILKDYFDFVWEPYSQRWDFETFKLEYSHGDSHTGLAV
jgi:hypothetical protein